MERYLDVKFDGLEETDWKRNSEKSARLWELMVRKSRLSPRYTTLQYDVFLSFRGKNIRSGFLSHLTHALSNAEINSFVDERLERGDMIMSSLLQAIEASKIFLVILSSNYASSRWCLDELVKIMECHKTYGRVVLPVFYNVDPSDVRNQRGDFGQGLEALAQRYLLAGEHDVLKSWKRALNEAGNLGGWVSRNYRNDADLVIEIVEDIIEKLDMHLLYITDFPVGLESRVQQVIKFINDQSGKGCVVGIWGMGGLGKTTIAKAIYNQFRQRFKRSFIEANNKGHIDLQEKLLSDVLKTKVKIHSVAIGISMIEKTLSRERALIILDDVTEFGQLKALCGNRKWIDQGSVLIITTRDLRLLEELKDDHVIHICRIKEMDENESLELFSKHAFREASPIENWNKLSIDVVAYCGGLPLALEVLGSYLRGRTKEEWESVLSKLKEIPNYQVQKKLRISFDGLSDHMEKNIFLDVCCFFIGKDRTYVTEILNGCGLSADIGITVLVERSLIKVEKNNKLGMHPLLRDMGREIICEGSRNEPAKRSRIWFQKDVLDVLTNNTGTETIQGLALELPFTSRDCFKAYSFEKMKELKLLQLDYVQLSGNYGYLSKQLKWICWQGFPSKYIPNNFYLKGVIVIEFKHSNLVGLFWKTPQVLQRLKILNLSHSKNLIQTPDFSTLPNLEKLILKHCSSLCNVHQSIGDLHNLILINLKGCTSLRNLPRELYKLKSVKILNLSGCSKIDKLEEDIVQMESLTTLIAENTAVQQVPFSIVSSKSIGYISLCGFEGLSRNVFPSIIWSWMSPTMNPLSYIHSLCDTSPSLISMEMQNNKLFDIAPMFRTLSNLRSVLVQCDTEIELSKQRSTILDDVNGANFTELQLTSYTSQFSKHLLRSYLIGIGTYQEIFNTLNNSISKGLTTKEACDVFLPGDNYPHWLAHTGEGHSVYFTVPENCHMKGMVLCVVYLSTPEITPIDCLTSVLMVNYTKCTIQIHKRDTVISFNNEDWQCIISHLDPGDKVEIFFIFDHRLVVKKTAVYLMYGKSIEKEMEPSPEPKKETRKNAFVKFIKKILIVAFGIFLFLSFHSLITKRSILYSPVLPRREEL